MKDLKRIVVQATYNAGYLNYKGYKKLMGKEIVSNCCSVKLLPESDICSKCKEHCEEVEL